MRREANSWKLEVIGVKRNGVRRYSAASKRRLLDACLRPGASIPALAAHHEVNATLLYKWVAIERRRRADREPALAGGSRERAVVTAAGGRRNRSGRELVASSAGQRPLQFIPVEICDPRGRGAASAAPAPWPRIGEQTMTGVPGATRLTVAMPNGVMLTMDGGDPRVVTAMIAALGGCHVPF